MIEGGNKPYMKNPKILEGFDFNDLITNMLVREPLLLYFVCRRGSWTHQNNRGKKHPPLDPRGIIKDREIDCKFMARFQFNNGKKDSHLVSVKHRKNWEKSMHTVPAKYCKLTNLGKKLYRHLKHNEMVQDIENNFSTGNNKDFVNNFVAKFNLHLPEDNEFEKINKNQRKRIDSHRQECKGRELSKKVNYKKNHSYRKPEDFSKLPLPVCNTVSSFHYDEIIKLYNPPDNEVLALLSKEYQTILDIIYKYHMTKIEHVIALKAKLIELTSLNIIKEDLKNGNKAWRLKNC